MKKLKNVKIVEKEERQGIERLLEKVRDSLNLNV